jgi:trk system potassium uptake protein TrkA
MKSVVIGLGQFGYASAISLARNGAEVVAIDSDMKIVQAIKEDVALAVATDASLKANLVALDIRDADVLVAAIGRNFESQLLTVVYAKQLGIPKIVARAGTQTHAEILREVGANVVLNPEEDSARRLVQSLLLPDIESYFELADGFSVVELPVPPALIGKTLRALDLRNRYRINVVALKHMAPEEAGRPAQVVIDPVPDPENVLTTGDVLAVVGSDLDISRFVVSAAS